MATIIYYNNLDYDMLPTAKKRRLNGPATNSSTTCDNLGQSGSNPPMVAVGTNSTSYKSYPGNDNFGNDYGRYSSNKYPSNSNTNTNTRSYPAANKFNGSTGFKGHAGVGGSSSTFNHNGRNYGSTGSSTGTYSCTDSSITTSSSCDSDDSPIIDFESSTHPSIVLASDYKESPTPLGHNNYNRSRAQPATNHRPVRARHGAKPVYGVPDKKLLLDTLKRYFNFTSFRANQFEAVNATCAGLDTLILMPTGGGKSICYQLPAIISEGITIVVSPLKSLIADQVQRMRSLNVKTSALSGETSDIDAESIIWDLRQECPEHKLLYVTPEKISASASLASIFKHLYTNGLLSRFVIDEAHCVSMWGSDFRPDYRKLGKLREDYPDVPIMALTATAPPKVRDDILNQLMMDKNKAKVFIQSFNRPNLKFEVRTKGKGCLAEICKLIKANFARQCGIIYCLSRNDCESTAAGLRENGIASAPYHAGLPDSNRQRVFDNWSKGTFQVVCATIAFGMGIDKSDVRFVIHYSLPKSIEGYYQEAGRAGRDGKFASCILYFSKTDLFRLRSMLGKTGFGRKVEDKNRDTSNLQHIIEYVDNKSECRRSIMLRYLGEEFDSAKCIDHINTACDNCLVRNNMR